MSQNPYPDHPSGNPSDRPGGAGRGPAKVPIFNAPPFTMWTCGLLIVLHVILQIAPRALSDRVWQYLAFLPGHFELELQAGHISLHSAVTLVTYAFLHVDWLHLLVNVGFLLVFGSVVERRFGVLWFVVIFALSSVAGAFTQLLVVSSQASVMIGASASVYGMTGAVLVLMITSQGPIRRLGFTLIMVFMGINLVMGFVGNNASLFGGTIAWQAHIGGFAAGMALGWILSRVVPPPGWRRPRPLE
ncbi:MAG: rhomboid family intramembrane serine protease [Pseudomonadota bacterium]